MIDFIFNELSAQPNASDKQEAMSCMTNILQIMSLAEENGLSGKVRTSSSFYMTELCNDYDINSWLNDAEQIERKLFLDSVTGLPFFDGITEEQEERVTTIEVSHNTENSDSLAASFILDFPLISFYKENWDESTIECQLIEIDDKGNISDPSFEYLINISGLIHYEEQTEWIKQRQKAQIKTSLDIWTNINHLFPNLEFTPNVQEHLENLNISEPTFTQVMKKLDNLEKYSKSWEVGGFDREAFTKCNPVSGETLDSYKTNYTFTKESGEEILAYWHLYYTPGAGRIYFAAMENTHRICICHIGGKLPDVTSRG